MNSSEPRTPAFDMSSLPAPPTPSRRLIQRLDIPVQIARVLLLILILIAWQVIVEREWVNRIFTATPREVWDGIYKIVGTGLFWEDLWVTLKEALAGFVIGGGAGLIVGLIAGRYVRFGKVIGPFLTFANALPKIALAPIFLLWFGVGEQSKIVLAVVVVFFIVQIPTQSAVGMIDPDLDLVVTSMGAGEFQKFRKVVLPGILAPVFGALRLAVIFSLLSVVFAEILSAKRGLGLRLITAKNNFNIGEMFAYTVVLAFLALALNGLVGLIERRALRWQEAGGGGQVLSI
jgi:NitT/TauT family transport system permease protein